MNGSGRENVDGVRAEAVPLVLRLRGLPSELAGMRREVRDWARSVGLSGERLDDLQLVVGEAAANAIEHGYRDGMSGSVDVWLSLAVDGVVHGRVQDYGSWRPAPDSPGNRGRGLDLIHALTAEMHLTRRAGGTEVSFQM